MWTLKHGNYSADRSPLKVLSNRGDELDVETLAEVYDTRDQEVVCHVACSGLYFRQTDIKSMDGAPVYEFGLTLKLIQVQFVNALSRRSEKPFSLFSQVWPNLTNATHEKPAWTAPTTPFFDPTPGGQRSSQPQPQRSIETTVGAASRSWAPRPYST
jgi:hypothetical protein